MTVQASDGATPAPTPSTDEPEEEMSFGKAAGLIIGLAALVAIIVICFARWDLITSLCAFVAAALGWLVGILIAPLSKNEEDRFGVIAKVISGFVTGYMVSKIDPLITELLKIDETGHAIVTQDLVAIRLLLAACSFLVAVLLVFNARAYWSPSPG